MKIIWVLPLLLSAVAFAAPSVTVLDNGLTVVTEEMDYSRSVAVVTLYRVGARNETDEQAGISHFTEHMLFNGTPDMPDTRFWQIVQKNGGRANAGTSQDYTIYYLHFPATRLEEALAIESDRMRNCPMDSATVADEIGVVLDEWRLGEDNPDGAIWRRVAEHIHPAHPYRRPVIGYEETIKAYTSQTVKAFYDTWYQPGNAVLAIVGNIDTEETLALVERYFGGIPGADTPDTVLPHDPPVPGPIRDQIRFPAESERLYIYFQGCDRSHPDILPLSFIASYLSWGRTSWLENNLVLTGLASSAGAHAPWGLDPSPFGIQVTLQEGVSADSAEALILAKLHGLSTDLLDPVTMEEIQRRYVASEILSSDNPLGIARRRAYYLSSFGDPLYYEGFLEAFNELTPEEVRDAASRYFIPERMVTVQLIPGGEAPPASGDEDPHRELAAPEDLNWDGLVITEDDLTIPELSVSEGVRRFTLENGMTLLVKSDYTFPIIEIFFTFPMGSRRTSPEMAGLAQLTTETMLGGTEELDRPSFHRRLEARGAGTWLRSNLAYTTGNTYGLVEDTELLFLSTSDLLTRPALREDDFSAAVSRLAGRLRLTREQPVGRVFSEADLVLEGEGNAFVVTEETVGAVSLNDVRSFHRVCARPSETVIAVVGPIEPEQALSLTERYFGGWTDPAEPLPELREYRFRDVPGDTMVATIDGRIQAATAVMCPAPGLSSPDEPAFSMLSRILGSGISSRLGRYIREQQGLAYAVWGYTDAGSSGLRDTARFTAAYATGASMNNRALQSAVNECVRIASEGVEEMELLIQQSRSVGAHALSYDTYGDLAEYLVHTETMGFPLDRDIRRLELLVGLTVEDVREAAAEYFTEHWFVYSAGGIGEDLGPLE